MEYLEQQLMDDPALQERMHDIEKFTQNFIRDGVPAKNPIVIPVVVHVVWKSGSQNLSDAQIISQIDVLNEDFRRMNADANNTWPQAADSQIEFCLASVDPSGNPTSGIQRRKTNKPSFQANDQMKFNSGGGLNAWPASDYLNMWVCNLSGGLLGYAQFPGGSASTDGVVIDYAYFGRGGSAQAPFDLGRTATHEVGHWLNLRHIWGDGGCSVDDFVSDTPLSDGPNYGCATGHVSCSTTDMVENYMDYSDDACMNLFTSGQSSRMNALFSPGGARAGLVNSQGCGGGTGGPTCSDGVQNGNETGVDCGGPDCPACPTCSDGVQNGNETGIDCGGPDCPACSTTCDAPTNLQHTRRKGGKEALLEWNAVSAATSYDVELDDNPNFTSPSSGSTTNTSIVATGLTKNNLYFWRVRANCASGTSDWAVSSFNARLAANSGWTFEDDIKLYPNPARHLVNIDIEQFPGQLTSLQVLNGTGQLLQKVKLKEVSTYSLDVSDYTNGIYFVRAVNDVGEVVTKKFVILK